MFFKTSHEQEKINKIFNLLINIASGWWGYNLMIMVLHLSVVLSLFSGYISYFIVSCNEIISLVITYSQYLEKRELWQST